MSFTINTGRIVADVRVLSVSGRRLIGGFELYFSIEVATPAIEQPSDAIVFSDWMATVNCGRSGGGLKQLGTALAATPVSLRNHGFADRQQVTLSLELAPEKLAGVEEERAGGDLALKLSLYAVGTHQAMNHVAGGPASSSREQRSVLHEELNYTVRMTEWIQLLEQMEYQRVMVFSVSLPNRPQSDTFSAAHAMLLRARDQMLQGHFDTVVSLARSVLESLTTVSGEQEAIGAAMEKFRAKGDVRKSMTKKERALVVQEAVRNYTHLAHHVADGSGAPEWYSRSDATFVLTLASAAFLEAATRQ